MRQIAPQSPLRFVKDKMRDLVVRWLLRCAAFTQNSANPATAIARRTSNGAVRRAVNVVLLADCWVLPNPMTGPRTTAPSPRVGVDAFGMLGSSTVGGALLAG